uniref:hypothetical protein n=1 Tax=Crenothrix polyspora TaxID=360316 RepID=UPI001C4FB8D5
GRAGRAGWLACPLISRPCQPYRLPQPNPFFSRHYPQAVLHIQRGNQVDVVFVPQPSPLSRCLLFVPISANTGT